MAFFWSYSLFVLKYVHNRFSSLLLKLSAVNKSLKLLTNLCMEANSEGPDMTAPTGAGAV